MADQYAISSANLQYIENNLDMIHKDLSVIDSGVGVVNDNVKVVYDEIGALARDFRQYVKDQMQINNKLEAQQNLIKIRQEMEKRFGHYDTVRKHTTGILQADDLGIVKKETISNITEELMISTPGYWLAPCLVALAAWISDQPELAERALKEGIRRNDEKTSLFFALICRRADRKQAALKWTQRYLENQDERNLDRKTVIILDAFASGLLGADTEGVVGKQIDKWLEALSAEPGFIEKQTTQWSEAITLKRKPVDTNSYQYLRKYSKTWPVLQDIMEGAYLHAEILGYFTSIFEKEASTESLKVQLDEILDSLVTDFDDEELPLKKEEQLNQFIVDFGGDIARAQQNMALEQTAFETHKDFTQLLTDAAMNPENAHSGVSTQKFAIALSKEWICDAYNDVTAKNRMKIPHEIEINVDSFNDKTTDGKNEVEVISRFNALIDKEKAAAIAGCVLSSFEKFCLYGGAAIAVLGLLLVFMENFAFGLIAIIAGIGMVIKHFSKKKIIDQNIKQISDQFEEKRKSGEQIVRATLAEVVDFRAEFAEKDSESQKVIDFLEDLSPDQYVRKLAGTGRKINV